jgi:hypothetical protein
LSDAPEAALLRGVPRRLPRRKDAQNQGPGAALCDILLIVSTIMSLEVLTREPHQVVALYEEVCLVVRWKVVSQEDMVAYHRALAKLHRRFPERMAFLQVNRFSPKATIGMNAAAQEALLHVLEMYGHSLHVIALVLPDDPFVRASLRSTLTRIALLKRLRLNYRPFGELRPAVNAVCEAMRSPTRRPLQPAELEAAVAELEKQRPTALAKD